MDVREMLDNRRFGAYQWAIVALCAACLVMDGFDVQAMGYVAPVVIREWGIAKEALSPVFGAGLFGMLIGSLVFSALADRIGRRPVLIGATLCFSVCMIATGFAQAIPQLIGWRFAAGFGLGCIMPNAMMLAGEYSPRRIRVSLMMIVSCGFTVGGVAGGLITAALIPHVGWRAVFFVGSAVTEGRAARAAPAAPGRGRPRRSPAAPTVRDAPNVERAGIESLRRGLAKASRAS
ncbi:sugar (and other) transporter family protein [Burkholderia thailandensis MSMB121]|nr:sugar (and other) transporter family protein [Burkholderia thailandensis MSMB121]